MKQIIFALLLFCVSFQAVGQDSPDEDQLGAWYMYFFTKKFGDGRFGLQGDYQFRSWNFGSDLEQLLLRTGVTYRPKNENVMFTIGYAYISNGGFGESNTTTREHRTYQEMLLPQKLATRFLFTHRFRYEQRWVENQNFRTRFRYNLMLNVPLNKPSLVDKAVYLALYNEIFINGEREIRPSIDVDIFDRNRAYVGLGYAFRANLRVQSGWMRQTTANWSKNQFQLGVHHNF